MDNRGAPGLDEVPDISQLQASLLLRLLEQDGLLHSFLLCAGHPPENHVSCGACKMFNVQCGIWNEKNLKYIMYNVQCTMYNVQCTM